MLDLVKEDCFDRIVFQDLSLPEIIILDYMGRCHDGERIYVEKIKENCFPKHSISDLQACIESLWFKGCIEQDTLPKYYRLNNLGWFLVRNGYVKRAIEFKEKLEFWIMIAAIALGIFILSMSLFVFGIYAAIGSLCIWAANDSLASQ